MAGPCVSIMMPVWRLRVGGFGADGGEHAAHPVVRRVGHVEAEDVDARVHELADHFGGVRGRAEGGNDFRAASRSSLHGAE